MSGGIVLAIVGVWVVAQVLGGNALGRLGIAGAPTQPGSKGPRILAPGPTTGVPVPGKYL